jgi:SsrA-binding protein
MGDIRKVLENRKARHDYHLLDRYEAGIELRGTEVKSLRDGKVNIADSYAQVVNGEIFIYDMHISPYEYGNRMNHDPKRPKKLLLHKNEIKRLQSQSIQKGFSLVPTRVYFNESGFAKVEIALAKGKHEYDKREEIKREEAEREIKTAMKSRRQKAEGRKQ